MSRMWRGLCALIVVGALGCAPHGFRTAEQLGQLGLGPADCARSCEELGMQMAALVLVQHSYSGCVCQPRATSGGASLSSMVSGTAAGQVAIDVAIRQQQQQQRQARR